MSDIKHTKGPWVFQPPCDPRGISVWGRSVGGVRLTEEDHKICDVRGWGSIKYLPNGEEIQDANGRLLAAAPELEIELEKMLFLVETIKLELADSAKYMCKNTCDLLNSAPAEALILLDRIRKTPVESK